jgi:hypothetical protein
MPPCEIENTQNNGENCMSEQPLIDPSTTKIAALAEETINSQPYEPHHLPSCR